MFFCCYWFFCFVLFSNPIFTPTGLGGLGRVGFGFFFEGNGERGLVTKLAAIDQIGKCAVMVIPHLGHGVLPAGSAD